MRHHPYSQNTAGAVTTIHIHDTTASRERTSMNLINEEYRIYSIGVESIPERYANSLIIVYDPKSDVILLNNGIQKSDAFAEILVAYLDLGNRSRKAVRDSCCDDRVRYTITEVLTILDRVSRIRRKLYRLKS